MPNVFDIKSLDVTLQNAKNKANAIIGDALAGRVLPTVPALSLMGKTKSTPIRVAGKYTNDENESITQTQEYTDVQIYEQDLENIKFSIIGTPMVFPLEIKPSSFSDNEYWLLPFEPVIVINGGHTLIRRNVAKGRLRGTIKERWNTDDYSIKIEGLVKKVDEWKFPYQDVRRLRDLLESKETLDVRSPLFEVFHIDRIAVEKYDFPFTKGEENQAYSITAYSDDNWSLLIEKENIQLL